MPNVCTYWRATTKQKQEINKLISWLPNELPVLILWIFEDNWTVVSTQRLLNYKNNQLQSIDLEAITMIDADIPLYWVDLYIGELLVHSFHEVFVIDVPNGNSHELISFWGLLRQFRRLVLVSSLATKT